VLDFVTPHKKRMRDTAPFAPKNLFDRAQQALRLGSASIISSAQRQSQQLCRPQEGRSSAPRLAQADLLLAQEVAGEWNKLLLLWTESLFGKGCVVGLKRWRLSTLFASLCQCADDACWEILFRWPPASRLPKEAELRQLQCWLNSVCEGLQPAHTRPDTERPELGKPSVDPSLSQSSGRRRFDAP
jgi:hypothetical protein